MSTFYSNAKAIIWRILLIHTIWMCLFDFQQFSFASNLFLFDHFHSNMWQWFLMLFQMVQYLLSKPFVLNLDCALEQNKMNKSGKNRVTLCFWKAIYSNRPISFHRFIVQGCYTYKKRALQVRTAITLMRWWAVCLFYYACNVIMMWGDLMLRPL